LQKSIRDIDLSIDDRTLDRIHAANRSPPVTPAHGSITTVRIVPARGHAASGHWSAVSVQKQKSTGRLINVVAAETLRVWGPAARKLVASDEEEQNHSEKWVLIEFDFAPIHVMR
jgi:hypothetical protein